MTNEHVEAPETDNGGVWIAGLMQVGFPLNIVIGLVIIIGYLLVGVLILLARYGWTFLKWMNRP